MSPYLRAIYRLKATVESPLWARRIVEEELGGELPRPQLEDIKLLVSELITNGIRHGSRREIDLITLELLVNGKIRCTVTDRGPGFATPAGGDPEGGWGLKLVEQLSTRWGLTRSPEGTEVWFETPLEAPIRR